MTKCLAALGASCVLAADVQLGLNPGGRLSECRGWTWRFSRRLLLHLYLCEGGRRHTQQGTPTPGPSSISSFTFSLSLSLYYIISSPDAVKKTTTDWVDRHILFTVLATEVILTGVKLVHTTTFHNSGIHIHWLLLFLISVFLSSLLSQLLEWCIIFPSLVS